MLAVVAVVTYGDPTHNVNATWNEGTSVNSGVRAPITLPFYDYRKCP